jgi:hypothetical protein
MPKRKGVPLHKRSKDDKRSKDAIIAEIVKVLDEPPAGAFEKRVRMFVGYLCADCQPFIGNESANNECLKDLSKQIIKLKRLLTRVPAPLSMALFWPGSFRQLYALEEGAFGINPSARTWLARSNPIRRVFLIELLNQLQAESDQIRRHGLGMHGRANWQKLQAARAAREIIKNVTEVHPEKKLSRACSETSAYGRIASLFFESVTGEHGSDLRRQCKMAASWPLRTKKQNF